MWRDAQFKRDLTKLLCLVLALAGTVGVFIITPALSTPTVLSIILTMLLSPGVTALERRGYNRALSIGIIFGTFALALFTLGFWAIQSSQVEWADLKEKIPLQFELGIQKLTALEKGLKLRYAFLNAIHPTENLVKWAHGEGKRFVENGPALMGEVLTWFFIVPPLTFVMLNDGRSIRRRFFQLIPNRFFESFFLVTNEITTAISDYLRAKLVEALLVGIMTTVGLAIVGAPYAVVLGILAGATNILPYIGPVVGAAPGIMIAAFDAPHGLVIPVVLVYLTANVIDTVLIFPVIVAKLVNLHPLILIAVVAVGQQYYGLVGMLISIPAASALKVVLQEVYSAVYEQRSVRYFARAGGGERAAPPGD